MKAAVMGILLLLLVTEITSDDRYRSEGYGVGAVYTATNGATKNQVVIYRLDMNGRLTRAGIIDTKGVGVNSTALDALGSQGRVVVYSNYLFVVNAGSNSLSMFWINPNDATKLKLLSVQPTNGQFPTSVTVNSKYACVMTTGRRTGIRCFTYNSKGLFWVRSFDRSLTSYVSHDIPLTDPQGTFSQILFSADNDCLIITVKGFLQGPGGYLLFFPFSNNGATLALRPTKQTPPSAVLPFSMSLVGSDGLLVGDAGSGGVQTMRYSSETGLIRDAAFTPMNPSIVGLICWSVYSPTIGNYYVVGTEPSAVVEIKIDLRSRSNPVKIIRYYPIPVNVGALDAALVTLGGVDYLYVLGTEAHVINSYRLNGPGNAVFNQVVVVQQNAANLPKLVGLDIYLQKRSSATY